MTRLEFASLEFETGRVNVSWTVEPATALYRQNHFTLDFGGAFDPGALPLKFWWTFVLLVLHSHWNLLRPCRIRLPIKLPDDEIEFWQRLLDSERVTLEKYRGTADFARTIEFDARGETLDCTTLPPPTERHATAYSGGKESLLQAGLLCELTPRPLLVTTYAPMPPMQDHDLDWRAVNHREIVLRRDCELVEVKSDLRAIWYNEFSRWQGYAQAVNEISDTFLYTANALAVSAGKGIRTVCLGAEFLHDDAALFQGHISQDYYFTYAPITMGALRALFERCGITFASLISPLTQFQVEQLLWRRYPELAELQISCYSMGDKVERYCNRCSKCERIALFMLANDVDPARIGLDVDKIFEQSSPRQRALSQISRGSDYAAAHINPVAARKCFRPRSRLERLGRKPSRSFENFEKNLAQRVIHPHPEVGLYRPAYLKFTPSALTGSLDGIYRKHWETDPTDRREELERFEKATHHITAPLRIRNFASVVTA